MRWTSARIPPRIRAHYRQIRFVLDLTVLTGAFCLAYLLRFEFAPTWEQFERGLIQLPFVVLIQFALLFLVGAYKFVWRYTSLADLPTFMRAATYSTLPLFFLRFTLPDSFQNWRVPLSVIVMDTVLAFGGVVGLRVLRRTLYERYQKRDGESDIRGTRPRNPVLLVGAGQAGVLCAREIQRRGDMAIEPVGFVDDDPLKEGSVIQGLRVLGTTKDLPRLVEDNDVDHVVITIAETDRANLRRIVETCERIPIRVRTMPGYYEILQGKVSISRIRDVRVEDLLGREPVHLEEADLEGFLSNNVVMVTGAGGSIGAELAQQIARFEPERLLLVERAEFVLFEVERRLRALWPDLDLVPIVADVGDESRMTGVFEAYAPEVVIHAAAHKHVPLMEANPAEAVKNNVFGTSTLGRLAGEHGVGHFVMVSTDKAVRPSSIMGATKRMAELVVQELDRRYPTTYVAVRFGNVLGSRGSVIPIFQEQIRRGGPVTVTHPEMTRYFMSVPESAQLVLKAAVIGEGGEIFVLDMGEPVRIVDLAEKMIRLAGFRPGEDIRIEFIGTRPGEKLMEELGHDEEELDRTRHPKIYIGKLPTYSSEQVQQGLSRLEDLAFDADVRGLRTFFNEFLPEASLDLEAPADAPVSAFGQAPQESLASPEAP